MSSKFTARAISMAMAATVTLSMLAGIDSLAYSQHAAHDLMAMAVHAITAFA
jgi:hypothetical protein